MPNMKQQINWHNAKILGGRCFSNKIVPDGWKIVKKNGKKVVCNKKLKCYCYKNSGKVMTRDIEEIGEYEDDFESIEDEDYLETAEEDEEFEASNEV